MAEQPLHTKRKMTHMTKENHCEDAAKHEQEDKTTMTTTKMGRKMYF